MGGSVGLLVLAGACGGGTSVTPTPDASPPIDSGPVDTGTDVKPPVDSGPDSTTIVDASSDATADVIVDAAPDVVVDASDGGSSPTGCSGGSDPYWSQVVAYIPCTNTITDASGKSTITQYNTPTVSATPSGAPGGASCSFGNGGTTGSAKGFMVTLPSTIGTGDFTVEIAVYQTAFSDPTDQQSEILITNSTYPPSKGTFPTFFSHQTNKKVEFIPGTLGTSYMDNGSALNTWESYAASRVNGTTYVFRNGALLTSAADTSNYTDTIFHVSHQANGPYNAIMGSAGQIRITKAGRYTSAYTPCTGNYATQ